MALDTRWKLPQSKTPEALYDCLAQLIRELRKSDYLSSIAGLSASSVDFAATQRVLGRNTAGAGAGEEVTLSQLLDWIGSAAQGDILYRAASAWARLGAGTSGQFLQTQGAAANPQWATVSGGITTIASGSLPAAATQSITSIPATYAHLILQLSGVSSNTATRQPLVRASTDNGSSYDSTVANYAGITYNAATLILANTALASLGESADAAAAGTWNVTINLFGYHAGPEMTYLSRFRTSAVGTEYHSRGTYRSTSAVNALQILWNGSGNFDAGTYALYGVS